MKRLFNCNCFNCSVLIFAVILAALAENLFGQQRGKVRLEDQSWRVLAKAQVAFDSGDYGHASALCQDARISRNRELEWNRSIMEYTLNAPEVKRKGPLISDLIPVLKEREDYEALDIINYWCDKRGAAFFNDSLPELYAWLLRLKNYPECDFLQAKIFRLEGEYSLAMEYLESARSQSDLLDVPAQKFDILYEMADLAKTMDDARTLEGSLLLIVAEDGLYKDETIKRAMQKSIQLKRKDIVSYFFYLFRHSSPNSIKAYYELGKIRREQKNSREGFSMTAFGSVCAFTHILDILTDRSPEYSWTTMESFLAECARYGDVLEWTRKNGFWKGLFDLAVISNENGWTNFGESLLRLLSEDCPDDYWKTAAAEKLH